MPDKNDDQNAIVVSGDSNMIPYAFSTKRITKSNCKLCQFEHRDEAEEIFENQKKKNYSAIKRELKTQFDFDIRSDGIRNHMLYHYRAALDNAALQEYADDVQKWVNMQGNRVASLRSRIGILEKQMFTISQESEDLDITEKRKSAETTKKLVETIVLLEDKLVDYEEEVKPVNLVFNQLKVIVNDELENIENVKTKKVVSTILSRLHDSVGSMIIE